MYKLEPKQSQDMSIILDSETKVFFFLYRKNHGAKIMAQEEIMAQKSTKNLKKWNYQI